MANGGYRHSRSPIRAVAPVSQASYGSPATQSSPWSISTPPEGDKSAPLVYHDLHSDGLACPECGATLKLQLLANHVFNRRPAASAAPLEAEQQVDFEETITTFKRELVSRALQQNGGVMTRAAKALNLKYTTFVAMAHRLGVVNSDGDKEQAEVGGR